MPDKPSSRGPISGKKHERKPQNVAEIKKKRSPLFWIFSIIILILIVLSFVVAPALTGLGSPQDEIKFGTYDGEPITFAHNNYFYHQYQNIASQWGGELSQEDYQWQMFQIWRAAFNNTVVFMDAKQRAEKTGLQITEERVQDFLKRTGPYVNEQGEFDPERYRRTSAARRQEIQQHMRNQILQQQVSNDLFSVKVPPSEADFVLSMGKSEKRFDYVAFDLQDYPLDKTAEYARENPEQFRQIDISRILIQTDRSDAETIRQRIVDGEITFEEAARTYSQDLLVQGEMQEGRYFYFELSEDIADTDNLQDLFTLQEGEISDIVETDYGLAIYRVNSPASEPDLEDEELLATIRTYMARFEKGVMEDHFIYQARSFIEVAEEQGFNSTASDKGLAVYSTDLFPINFNDALLLNQISDADPEGILAQASSDDFVLRELFRQERGDMTQPLPAGNKVIVAICREESTISSQELAQMRVIYPYYISQIQQQEYSQMVLQSDKLDDRFMQVFINTLMR